jgi:hypothetical protein
MTERRPRRAAPTTGFKIRTLNAPLSICQYARAVFSGEIFRKFSDEAEKFSAFSPFALSKY